MYHYTMSLSKYKYFTFSFLCCAASCAAITRLPGFSLPHSTTMVRLQRRFNSWRAQHFRCPASWILCPPIPICRFLKHWQPVLKTHSGSTPLQVSTGDTFPPYTWEVPPDTPLQVSTQVLFSAVSGSLSSPRMATGTGSQS